jgi:hypothetical protein
VWQALREELHPKGLEIVAVGQDVLGAEGCRAFIEAAKPSHPSLIDRHHVLAERFGVINIPSSIWIDEQGVIVRPAETAPAPPAARPAAPPPAPPPGALPPRFLEILAEAAKIRSDAEAYHAALRDWVEHGARSRFALTPEQVVARSRPRDADKALGHAHFELACELEIRGEHQAAVQHFREAHRLVPDSWTFRRQAWSLEKGVPGPLARFWQGPSPEDPGAWPYAGDWLSDVRESGAENYNDPWTP